MDYSYIAGFTDGDGSFEFTIRHKHKGKYSWWEPQFSYKLQQKTAHGENAVKCVAEFLKADGIAVCLYPRRTKYKGSGYKSTELRITSKKALKVFVSRIVDKLIVKKHQAEVFLQLLTEVEKLPRRGLGGKKFTIQVCASLLEKWEPVRLRKSMNRTWSSERLLSLSRLS